MQKIEVITISTEEVEHGVAELWEGGQQIAFTLLDEGELKLWFKATHDGSPVVVGLESLTAALAEVHRIFAPFPGWGATLDPKSSSRSGPAGSDRHQVKGTS